MAGAYTDNQPDFSYLAPGETKTFSQYFWPIQQTGPVQASNERAALRLVVGEDRRLDLGVLVSAPLNGARIVLTEQGRVLLDHRLDLKPGAPFRRADLRLSADEPDVLSLRVFDAAGLEVIAYQPATLVSVERRRSVATEPPAPAAATNDELFFIGEHLEQYRHPTRAPEPYWQEMLRRDAGDARAHLALGRRLLRSGQFAAAATHLEQAITRLTSRHPNPVTGEAHYHLALVRRWQDRPAEAYALFYKAVWNYEWRASAYYELAAIDCRRGDFTSALAHLELSLDTNRQNNKALVLKAATLRRLGRLEEARQVLAALLATDPLDHWARTEEGFLTQDFSTALTLSRNDGQTALDIAFDYADAGFYDEATAHLERHLAQPVAPSAVPNPLSRTQSTAYALAWLDSRRGAARPERLARARSQSPDYFFPSRLHEQVVLEWAMAQPGGDANAAFAFGNYCFDLKRHEDAISAWEQSLAAGASWATVHRNLGIAYWNIRRDGARARTAYEQALVRDPADARLVSEFDQLAKKLNVAPADRLAFLEKHRALVAQRDDATVELAALYNVLDRPAEALALLSSRRFHPWEGGEGRVLRQYTAARLALGEKALEAGDAAAALEHFTHALDTPANLGEAYHLHQAKADVNYWIGRALSALERESEAARHFQISAAESGDFKDMAVATHSPLSFYRGLSLRRLGRNADAEELFGSLLSYAHSRMGRPEAIDYFATSLPNLLVFEEDLSARRDTDQHLLAAFACLGLGDHDQARIHLDRVLTHDRSDLHAAFLARQLEGRADPSIKPLQHV